MANRVNRAPDRSSKFSYKGRDFKTAKERSERRGGSWESIFKAGVDTWRPKEGDNQIRILPIPDSEHYAVQVWTHDRIGPDNSQFVCPRKMSNNKPCAICDMALKTREAGEVEEAKALGVKEHWVCWIIDREDEERPKLYIMSATQDSRLVSICLNNRTGSVVLIDEPNKGFDVIIKRIKTGKDPWNVDYQFVVERESTPINENKKVQQEILNHVSENPIEDLLVIRPSSYLSNVLIGANEERDEDLDEEEEDRPHKKRREEEEEEEDNNEEEEARQDRKSTKSKRHDEEEEEEDNPLPDDEEGAHPMKHKKPREEEEEEEEEKPAARSKKRARDEEEEDPEEEIERPRSKKKPRDEEEEEEESEEEEEDERPRKKLGRR